MTEQTTTTTDPGAGGGDWRAPLVALAGDNAEFKTALDGFKEPTEIFAKLTAQPQEIDWRKTIAGEDADALKGLERFDSAKSFYDSFKQKDAYINSGKKVTVPGENASAEEIAAWNNARGVPEKASDYKITAKPPEGLEVDESTGAMLGTITERLHKVGAEPAVVNLAHEIVYEQAAAAQDARDAQIEEGPKRAQAELQKVWKTEGEFKENASWAAAAAYQFIGAKGSPELEAFSNLVIVDGEGKHWRMGDHPGVVQIFAKMGRAGAEDPIFLDASGAGNGAGSVDEQIAAIMKLRETDPKKYNAPETRDRHQKLLAARARHRELHGGRAA